jgi:hypothetical protein
MPSILIPPPRVPLTDGRGSVTLAWYLFFSQFGQQMQDAVDTGAATSASLGTSVAALQAADDDLFAADRDLFIDDAMTPDRGSEVAALTGRVRGLETDVSSLPDPGSQIAALAARLTALETDIATIPDRAAELEAIRRRLRDLEIDIATRGF